MTKLGDKKTIYSYEDGIKENLTVCVGFMPDSTPVWYASVIRRYPTFEFLDLYIAFDGVAMGMGYYETPEEAFGHMEHLASFRIVQSEHLQAIVGMPGGCHGRALDRDEADPDTYAGDGAEEPAPDFVMISIEPGARASTFRFTAEMSFKAVAVAGKFGAALFPFFGLVEAEQKRERESAAREAAYNVRLDRLQRAGRVAFHRTRKASTPEEKWEILGAIGCQFDLKAEAIDLALIQYGKTFLARLRERRNARIRRMHVEGLHDREIANHPLVKVSITTVKKLLGKNKRGRW